MLSQLRSLNVNVRVRLLTSFLARFFWQYGLSLHVDLFNVVFFRPNSGDDVAYHHQCGDRNGIFEWLFSRYIW